MTALAAAADDEPRPWLPYALLVGAMLLFSGALVLGRVVHAEVPPAGMTFWRAVAAFLLLLPFVWRRCLRAWPQIRAHWPLLLAVGVAQTVTGQIPVFAGLGGTTAVNAGLIGATQPALIVLLAWALLREPIVARQAAGLAIAFAGTLVVVARGDPRALAEASFAAGDLWVQVGIASWALYAILVKRATRHLEPLVIFEAMTALSILACLPPYAIEMLAFERFVRADLATAATVLYLAGPASVVALVFLAMAVRRIGPTRSGVFNYLIPIFTAGLAFVVIGERLEAFHLVGLVLVVGGVYMTSRPKSGRPAGRPRP